MRVLTATLNLKLESGHNIYFGNYDLYLPEHYKHHEIKSYAGHFIYRCLVIAGENDFSKIAGKLVRVCYENAPTNPNVYKTPKVYSIGHIWKDIWFAPSEDFGK